ncbi:sensor domain-containing protein [Methylohalomonas lacus]|nr:GGDEF and EAL domain-containing protein [Methylohalomonas lacus]
MTTMEPSSRFRALSRTLQKKKLAQEEARRLAERLMSTLESITDAFFILNHEWRFTYLNQQAERLLQRDRNDLVGKFIWEEFPEAINGIFYREYHRAMSEKCTVGFEEYFDPLETWFEVNAYPSEEGLAVYFRDITERKAAQRIMHESEERFRNIARATADAVWDWDMKTDVMWWNDGIHTLFGYSPKEIESDISSWTSRIHPDEKDQILAEVHHAIDSGAGSWTGEYRFRRKDGSYAYVWDRSFIIRDEYGKAVRMLGGKNDITESKLQQARLTQQAELLDKAHDAIIIRDMDNHVSFWNKGAERLYGWTAEEVAGRHLEEFLYEDTKGFRTAMEELQKNGEWRGELEPIHKNGKRLIIEAHWTLIQDDAGYPESILAINTDITQRKAAEHEIQYLAFYDQLTQLPNRQLMLDRLQRAINATSRNGQHGALLFIDLDNFKILNDTLGHDIGDLLLQQVAQRLTTCIRESDSLSRLGGDEFVVMLENLGGDSLEAASQAETIGEKILAALNESYSLSDYEHQCTPSIGITLFSNQEHNMDELQKRADLAMYQAKGEGRNTIRFFDPDMQAAITNRITLEADLRSGLKQNDFLVYYQPQIVKDGKLLGAEALLRWQHPSRGLVSPTEFIPLAEDTGLILPLSEFVLMTACNQLVAWAQHPETAELNLSVNISARQFHHRDFVDQVLGTLAKSGANPENLTLELTESLLVEDMESVISKMTTLKSRGISFSLDDFGTGYSSLSYLKRLPLDILKIDQSFIRDLLTDPSDEAIVRTVISLGQSLELAVIAEGVETGETREALINIGCHVYQGYLFSHPLPIEEFNKFIRKMQTETITNKV